MQVTYAIGLTEGLTQFRKASRLNAYACVGYLDEKAIPNERNRDVDGAPARELDGVVDQTGHDLHAQCTRFGLSKRALGEDASSMCVRARHGTGGSARLGKSVGRCASNKEPHHGTSSYPNLISST